MVDTTLSLLCRVGGHLTAVPLAHVIEIMRPLPVRAVADVPAWVRGVSLVRGVALPVLDVARLLGEPESEPPRRFVCVRSAQDGTRQVALLVTDVPGVRSFPAAQLAGLPPLLRGAGSEALRALGALDRELLLVLDTGRIVPEAAWSALDGAAAGP